MLDLLEKFETVEIKNNTRLAEEDLRFCEQQHELYIKVLKHYRNMFSALQEFKKRDNEFYNSVKENDYYSGGNYICQIYSHEFVKADKEDFKKTVERTHNIFIRQINGYFRNKYNVSIEEKDFEDYSKFEKPEDPDKGWRRRQTDEELEQALARRKEYEAKLDNYLDNIINAEMHYSPIIDDIFNSLDGFSFTEKADKEIKDAAKEAVKNKWTGELKYTVNNGRISFSKILFSHKCSVFKRYEISLDSSDYKSILKALTYFDSDYKQSDIYNSWINDFVSY